MVAEFYYLLFQSKLARRSGRDAPGSTDRQQLRKGTLRMRFVLTGRGLGGRAGRWKAALTRDHLKRIFNRRASRELGQPVHPHSFVGHPRSRNPYSRTRRHCSSGVPAGLPDGHLLRA